MHNDRTIQPHLKKDKLARTSHSPSLMAETWANIDRASYRWVMLGQKCASRLEVEAWSKPIPLATPRQWIVGLIKMVFYKYDSMTRKLVDTIEVSHKVIRLFIVRMLLTLYPINVVFGR